MTMTNSLHDSLHASFLLGVPETRSLLINDRPVILETSDNLGVFVPLTPAQEGYQPDFHQAQECIRYPDGGSCDRWAIFEPNATDRTGLCATHLQMAGRAVIDAWIEAIIAFLEENGRIEHQSLRMSIFEGLSSVDRLEFPEGSKFTHCDFPGAKFVNCRLRDAVFDGNTRFLSTVFESCDLGGSFFNLEKPMEKVEFNHCDFRYATFTGVNCSKALFRGGDLRSLRLDNTDVSKWIMKDVDFSNSRLHNVNFVDVKVVGSSFAKVDFNGRVVGCHFEDVDFTHTDFGPKVAFSNSKMHNCKFSKRTEEQIAQAELRDQLRVTEPKWVDSPPPMLAERPTTEQVLPGARENLKKLKKTTDLSFESLQILLSELRPPKPGKDRHNTGSLRTLALMSTVSLFTGLGLEAFKANNAWVMAFGAGTIAAVLDRYDKWINQNRKRTTINLERKQITSCP